MQKTLEMKVGVRMGKQSNIEGKETNERQPVQSCSTATKTENEEVVVTKVVDEQKFTA